MPSFIDFDGRECLIVEARGRIRHSKLLSEVKARGDLLLADKETGALFVKKSPGYSDNLFIRRHRGNVYIRVKLDETAAYDALCNELKNSFMTSHLVRKFPDGSVLRVFAADILKNTTDVKRRVKRIVNGLY